MVPKSHINNISMISTDFDGNRWNFQISLFVLSKGFCSNTRKSLKFLWFAIKIGRDHRDILDMRLRDHFFRVCRLPKTFPSVWEVLETSFTAILPLCYKIIRGSDRYPVILIHICVTGPLNWVTRTGIRVKPYYYYCIPGFRRSSRQGILFVISPR